MRQLAEYEKQPAGQDQQMGIDISDVLTRTAILYNVEEKYSQNE